MITSSPDKGATQELGILKKKETQGDGAASQDTPFESRQGQVHASWKKEGFPSVDIATLICQAVNPFTPMAVQESCIAALRSWLEEKANSGAPGGKQWVWQLCAMPTCSSSMMKSFQAMAEQVEAHIKVSHLLSHMCFPIGESDQEGEATLLGMVDTGAGLNIGRLGYHCSISERFPQLVAQFALIKDIPGMEPLSVGGIGSGDGNPTALECMAIITYKMPFIVSGQPVVVSFALGEGVACNTVFSYPFLSALEAGIVLENMTVTCEQLKEVFQLEALVPLAVAEVPAVPKGVPGTFQTREIQPSALKKRGRLEDGGKKQQKKVRIKVRTAKEPGKEEKQPQVETGVIQVASASCQE